jgi:hypothetical protein
MMLDYSIPTNGAALSLDQSFPKLRMTITHIRQNIDRLTRILSKQALEHLKGLVETPQPMSTTYRFVQNLVHQGEQGILVEPAGTQSSIFPIRAEGLFANRRRLR